MPQKQNVTKCNITKLPCIGSVLTKKKNRKKISVQKNVNLWSFDFRISKEKYLGPASLSLYLGLAIVLFLFSCSFVSEVRLFAYESATQ